MLELRNIKKDYVTASETVNALRGVSVTFRDKEFVSVLGPSGCGKTTLLNIVGGLDHYTSGDLVINGRSTKSYKDRDWDIYRNHRVGFIFQSYNLIPHQTILGNVELALTISGIGKRERIARAKHALDRVGLNGQYYKKPNQLSGGQCQRVAIARALVNDPEILLADEPTGALDTVTSVQIMDLIREIADERLVIMVTHNPELAEQYSTRIIRLLDGNLTEDTNPVSEKEYSAAIEAERSLAAAGEREAEKKTGKKKREPSDSPCRPIEAKSEDRKFKKSGKKEKAKMSFFTAFKLSARNLISKKGRTSMVGVAGSIGIIGIALVLAFSSGIKGYVKSMQDDLLSGNPIKIRETTYDFEGIMDMMSSASDEEELKKEPGKVFINSMIKYILETSKDLNSTVISNTITKDYVEYIESMPEEYYAAMLFDYGIDLSNNIYTSFEAGGKEQKISISALTNIYTALLSKTDFSSYSSYVTEIVPSFEQAPNSKEYISQQYDVVGEIADEYDEVMLVLDRDERLSDLLLARLGYFSQDDFVNLVKEASGLELPEGAVTKNHFTHEELLEKTFTYYPNDSVFTKNSVDILGKEVIDESRPFFYHYDASEIEDAGIDLRVVGILYTNETTTYGCLSSGIYYTDALSSYVLENNNSSEIANYIREKGDITTVSMAGKTTGIYYNYDYLYDVDEDGTDDELVGTGFVGGAFSLSDMMGSFSSMMGGMGGVSGGTSGSTGGATSAFSNMKTLTLKHVGGSDIAKAIDIYPLSFDSKNLVTDYLDGWNSSADITLGDRTLLRSERVDITYTDALELVINLINGMIDVVSAALIAFTSISLVVSTVMIGIITYVSVVERIKEIGVIRSLGGRKKDVSRLFTAETFIIGFLSGLIGVVVSYLIALLASTIVYGLIGIPNIAMLEFDHAVILVILSVFLTLISGVMPARSAARKDPVVALRTE